MPVRVSNRKGLIAMNENRTIKVELDTFMLYDRLHLLAVETDISVDGLVNVAVRRLINDVEVFQGLRKGNVPPSPVRGE